MPSLYKNTLLIILLCFSLIAEAQRFEQGENGTFALTNATIVTVTKGTLQSATLVIQDGKIAAVGTEVTIPQGATIIDCEGQFVYPGMIDSGTSLGLVEIGAVSLTRDNNELGDITPHAQALTAVNPNSIAIPVTRVDGVTTVLSKPAGGLFPGTAALIDLYGYTPDQMYAGFKGVVMNYPSAAKRSNWDRRSEEDRKKEEEKKLKMLNNTLDNARLYVKISDAAKKQGGATPDYNPQMAALAPVIRGTMPLMIEVNRKQDIESALEWVAKQEGLNIVFTGVAEGWRVADKIAAAKIPVITGPIITLPTRASDPYDAAYANAGKMHQAGVLVAIRSNDTENVRNLPFHAGFAAAYGMGKEAALEAVTINAAKIFGLENQIGSIEKGKIANLIVTDGDPFEPKTKVNQVFINGWKISMSSRHTYLYEEFLKRAPGVEK